MREKLSKLLENNHSAVLHWRFLIYVMGPYKSHLTEDAEMFDFLETVRDDLRREDYNAFLATDPEIPLDEMDAGTQSLEFARASNVVLFIVPNHGKNLGVGIEVGAVLEDMSERQRERVLFLHEKGMSSAMIGSIGDRWDATVRTYEDESGLLDETRLFIRDVMRKEGNGELERFSKSE